VRKDVQTAFDVLGIVPSRDNLLHKVLALLCVKSISSVGVCGGREYECAWKKSSESCHAARQSVSEYSYTEKQ